MTVMVFLLSNWQFIPLILEVLESDCLQFKDFHSRSHAGGIGMPMDFKTSHWGETDIKADIKNTRMICNTQINCWVLLLAFLIGGFHYFQTSLQFY